MEPVFTIQMASRMTGLSQNLIRAWENRYRVVEPNRSPTKRRVYSQAEVDRLALLKQLTDGGHSIGQIAKLTDSELVALLPGVRQPWRIGTTSKAADSSVWIEEALAAIRDLDTGRMEAALKNAAATLGAQGTLMHVIAPLAETVGSLWREGRITAAHEHFGTGMVRDFLRQMARQFAASERGPAMVVATPAGQLHEMGALMAGAFAANLGWRVTHLGASLPAAEIAAAARQKTASVVALSVIFPEDDIELARDLELLRELLPNEVTLIVGGRAAAGYRDTLSRLGALIVADLAELGATLDKIRKDTSTPQAP